MKKLILMAGIMVATIWSAQAQEKENEDVLLHLPKLKTIGFYIAPEIQYGQVKDFYTTFTGISAGVLFNKRFSIGLTSYNLFNQNAITNNSSAVSFSTRYSGLKMEYTFFPKSPIHLNIPLVIARGGYTESLSGFGRGPRTSNNLFVIQSGAFAEANLLKSLKVYTGITFRYSTGINSTVVNPEMLSGLSYQVGIKVGVFGKKVGK